MANFRYFNINPNQEQRNDCVTRAITLAVGNLPYSEVRRKLYHTAKLLDCKKLCPTCYSFAIQEVFGGIPKNCEGMTIGEFADMHPNGTYLVRIDGHLSIIIDNVIYDTWDCRNRICTNCWKMP